MTGDNSVVQALLSMLAAEAQLNIQYRNDWRILRFMGIKKVACKVNGFGDHAHDFMKIIADQVLDLGGSSAYSVGAITNQTSLTATLQNEMSLEMALVRMGRSTIQTCVKVGDEATAEKIRHVEERHEDAVLWIEKQLRLIAGIGEDEYIGEKL